MTAPAPITTRAKKMTRRRASISGQWSVVSGQASAAVVQVVLEDDRGGDGVELAARPHAAHVAALRAGDGFGCLSAQALVPHLDGYAEDPLRNAREVLGAAGLAPSRSIGVQRQADHHPRDAFDTRDFGQLVENGGKAVPAIQDG